MLQFQQNQMMLLEEPTEMWTSGVWALTWNCSGAKEGQVANRIMMFCKGSREIQETAAH